MNALLKEEASRIEEPKKIGSYDEDDCIFLVKSLNESIIEETNEEREEAMRNGRHYSEMLPIEYAPSLEYVDLFHSSLDMYAKTLAKYVAYVSELIVKEKGSKDLVLVSLARGGSPIGVLIKRYLKMRHIDAPHYSISIIRGKGIDTNALKYIVNKHGNSNGKNIQFIDGWTGKGVIGKELEKSIEEFNTKYETEISSELAVLSDPSSSASMYGTREDFLIPSACLNSTVSGLVSRTVRSANLIGPREFDGVKYYDHLREDDLTDTFIDAISKHFQSEIILPELKKGDILNTGFKEVSRIQEEFNITDINKIKPGVGETTRVLLRRVPDKILVKDYDNIDIQHILLLAKEKNVEVILYKDMSYACIGLIAK